jgi:hypothetical protein
MLSGNDLLKGGVGVALIWWTWFRPNDDKDDTQVLRLFIYSDISNCHTVLVHEIHRSLFIFPPALA